MKMKKILFAIIGYVSLSLFMTSFACGKTEEDESLQVLPPIKLSNEGGVTQIMRQPFVYRPLDMKKSNESFVQDFEYTGTEVRAKLVYIKDGKENVVGTITKKIYPDAAEGVDRGGRFMDCYFVENRIHYIYSFHYRVYVSYAEITKKGRLKKQGEALDIGALGGNSYAGFITPNNGHPLSIISSYKEDFLKHGNKVYELNDENEFELKQTICEDGTPEVEAALKKIYERKRYRAPAKSVLPKDKTTSRPTRGVVTRRTRGFFPHRTASPIGYPRPEMRPTSFVFEEEATGTERRTRLLFVENGRESIIDSMTVPRRPYGAHKTFCDCYRVGDRLHYIYYVNGNYYATYADKTENGQFKKSDNALCLSPDRQPSSQNIEFRNPENGKPLSINLYSLQGYSVYELNDQNEFEFKRLVRSDGETPEERKEWADIRRYLEDPRNANGVLMKVEWKPLLGPDGTEIGFKRIISEPSAQ